MRLLKSVPGNVAQLNNQAERNADTFLRGAVQDEAGRTEILVSNIFATLPDFGTKTRVLDLACGATAGTMEYSRTDWGPWLLRALSSKGMSVMGVDYGDLTGESFPGMSRIDLTKRDALSKIPSDSFDLIHLHAFWDSPTFGRTATSGGFGSPEAAREIVRTQRLHPQIHRILAPGGIFMDYDGSYSGLKVYRKD